jgi:integrase
VDGVKRPTANGNEGSTPALGDAQARRLLEAPALSTLNGMRDRAILGIQLYHGIRREELCLLRIRDMQSRQGVMHFRIHGKRSKIRFVPVHPMAQRLIQEYLASVKHGGGLDGVAEDGSGLDGPLFRPVKNNRTGTLDKHLLNNSLISSATSLVPGNRQTTVPWPAASAYAWRNFSALREGMPRESALSRSSRLRR